MRSSIDYLVGQFKAGAEVVQIFDTWAGVLGPGAVRAVVYCADAKNCRGCAPQVPDAKIIGFPRGAGAMALPYVEMTGVSAIGIDWTFERSIARDALQPRVPVQGNVDPLALLAGGAALDREVDDVMKDAWRRSTDLQSRPWHFAGNADRAMSSGCSSGCGGIAMYLWLKALHIIAVVAWMAGMLYLPRLFVYHAAAKPGSELSETFKMMERRLLKLIMTPAMIVDLDPRHRLLACRANGSAPAGFTPNSRW